MRGIRRNLVVSLTLFVGALLAPPMAVANEDDESATHGDQASTYQLIGTYEYPGFKILQFDLAVLSHYSYMLISDGQCCVVDPGRDIDRYVASAGKEHAAIRDVWLSHTHADFVAGHGEFAKQLNVPIHISRQAGAKYPHQALREGDRLTIGRAVLTFIETPGHTPDSMCAIVATKQAPDKPLVLLSGDTLFIGSVGRPDLLGENMSAATLASMMFDTWNNQLSKLPDDVVVLPAHGAGSLCGTHLSDQPSSTIGEQRVSNGVLQYRSDARVVDCRSHADYTNGHHCIGPDRRCA